MPSSARSRPTPRSAAYGEGWGSPLEDVTMPSGALAQLRRPGINGLVAAGVLENVDQLGHLVGQKIGTARGARPAVDLKKIAGDAQALKDIMIVLDKILCYVVVQPALVSRYRPGPVGVPEEVPFADRDHQLIYSDSVPEQDQYFILNYAVGGTRDLERFREEFAEVMGALENGDHVPSASKRAVGTRQHRRS